MVNWQTNLKKKETWHCTAPLCATCLCENRVLLRFIILLILLWSYFFPAVCSSTWILFRWWNRDLSSRSSFLSSSFPSAFYSTLLPLQSSMLHGVLSNYANAALVGDQDTGGVQDHSLKQLLSLWSTVINIPVCVFFILFLFSFWMHLMDMQSLIMPGG